MQEGRCIPVLASAKSCFPPDNSHLFKDRIPEDGTSLSFVDPFPVNNASFSAFACQAHPPSMCCIGLSPKLLTRSKIETNYNSSYRGPGVLGGQAGSFNAPQYQLHAESQKQCQDPCLTIGRWLLVLIQDKDDPSRKDMLKNHAAGKLGKPFGSPSCWCSEPLTCLPAVACSAIVINSRRLVD